MKIKLLNKALSKDSVTRVLVPFPTIRLPVNNKKELVREQEATSVHYSTLVYSLADESFYVFEFGQDIVDGLLAYKDRHGTITNVEILLSRESDGSIRMSCGKETTENTFIGRQRYEQHLDMHNKLFSKYMEKLGRTVCA